jgi:hypothetical protein
MIMQHYDRSKISEERIPAKMEPVYDADREQAKLLVVRLSMRDEK